MPSEKIIMKNEDKISQKKKSERKNDSGSPHWEEKIMLRGRYFLSFI